jgi:hypothetical protein
MAQPHDLTAAVIAVSMVLLGLVALGGGIMAWLVIGRRQINSLVQMSPGEVPGEGPPCSTQRSPF